MAELVVTDDVVERAAQAAYESWHEWWMTPTLVRKSWGRVSPETRESHRVMARAALEAALNGAGS